jgi:hypothetical protein
MADRDPWFKFYSAHWLTDLELISLPMDTQGVYANLLLYLYQTNPPGFLLVSGVVPTEKCMGKVLRIHPSMYRRCLQQLLDAKVLKLNDAGVVFSQRIVSDSEKRARARAAGKKGGNPAVTGQGVKGRVNPEVKIDIEKEKEKEKEEDKDTDDRLSQLFRKWEQTINLVPPADVLPGLRLTLEWLDNQIALNPTTDILPSHEIILGEIDDLANRFPDKQTINYLFGTVRGKWGEFVSGVEKTKGS